MKNKAKNIRILLAVALAALFVVSGMLTVATALNLPFGGGAMARMALAGVVSAGLCGLAAVSTPMAIASLAAFGLSGGIWTLANLKRFGAMRAFFGLWQGQSVETTVAVQGGRLFMTLAAALLGAVFFLLLYRRELTSMAVMILTAMLISGHAMSETASVAAMAPGLAAAAAAFALSGGVQRDAAAPRVLVPSMLAVALALMLLPAGRVTWKPLEDAGNRVRGMFEQYFSFTHERIAFSISEKGYNHGGEVDGQTVAMLGGPAQPDDAPVMRVTADGEALLRGTIRSTYTGYSWVDLVPKSRYLYFDLTHRSVRDRVFDMASDAPAGAFTSQKVSVELLSKGTSTLFVPGRLSRFSMPLSSAVYYNSAGELFMAREVQPGDAYGATGLQPVYGEALRQAVIRGELANDERYAEIHAAHTELNPGIDSALYSLTIDITRDAGNAYDRAEAIARYLRQNMRYRLDVEYPPVGRDFVSWFVLESKTGYCSYFASAMAVMGRIAGLPTRYVEGYLARPGADGTATLTGQDAHAWAEIYFRGVGWVPFDATGGTTARGNQPEDGSEGGGAADPDAGDGAGDAGETATQPPIPDATPEADATPAPEDGQGEAEGDAPEETPTPEPEDNSLDDPGDAPEDSPEDDADAPEPPEAETPPEDAPDSRRGPRLVLGILLALLLIALLALWVRLRLRASDPVWLCGQTKRAQQAAMIAYRANLTLLNQMGQGPVNGETPEAFVRRVSMQLENPDYERFVQAVAMSRYGNKPLKRADVQAGLNAYGVFMGSLSRLERLRYGVYRVLHGLGSFEQIP